MSLLLQNLQGLKNLFPSDKHLSIQRLETQSSTEMTLNPGAAVFDVQRRAPAAREKRRGAFMSIDCLLFIPTSLAWIPPLNLFFGSCPSDTRAGKRAGTKLEATTSPKPVSTSQGRPFSTPPQVSAHPDSMICLHTADRKGCAAHGRGWAGGGGSGGERRQEGPRRELPPQLSLC